MYDHASVEALQRVRRIAESLGPSILYRKLFGILNAIEMQIEDGQFRLQAVHRLGEALMETASFYGLNPAVTSKLAQELATFVKKLKPKNLQRD
jgi:hypothetical protein